MWNMEIKRCFSVYTQHGQDQSRRQQRDVLRCLNISAGTDTMRTTAIAGKSRKRARRRERPIARTPAAGWWTGSGTLGTEAGPHGWLETAFQQTKHGRPVGSEGLRGAAQQRAPALSAARPAAPSATGALRNKRERQRTKKPGRAPAASPCPTAATARPRASAPRPPLPCRCLSRCLSRCHRPAASLFRSASGTGPPRLRPARCRDEFRAGPRRFPNPGRQLAEGRLRAPGVAAAALPWPGLARDPQRSGLGAAPGGCTAFPERRPLGECCQTVAALFPLSGAENPLRAKSFFNIANVVRIKE